MNVGNGTIAGVERMLEQHGLHVESCEAMPKDKIALISNGEVVGSIHNIGKPKAIEPDAFFSSARAAREAERQDMNLANSINKVFTPYGAMTKFEVPKWNPDAWMRAQGYTLNPDLCVHYKKRMSAATMRFRCLDCGKEL